MVWLQILNVVCKLHDLFNMNTWHFAIALCIEGTVSDISQNIFHPV